MDAKAKTSMDEIKRRLDGFEKLHAFVTDFANWDATCDSWWCLFKNYQRDAKKLLEQV